MAPAGYNVRKAAQVVAYLANKSPQKRLNVLKAVKLVYLADRESMSRFGFPILDEDRVSMPWGPVNSTTYRYVNGEFESEDWKEFLRDRSNHLLSVTQAATESDWDEMSDADVSCLDHVWAEFGHMDRFELAEWTHDAKNIPEWEDPDGGSFLIPIRRVLKMLAVENAEEHGELIEEQRRISRLLETIRQ
jgi:uncharacterized phage-associated protein